MGSLRADSGSWGLSGRAGVARCSLLTGEVPWLSHLPGLPSPWQCHKSSLLEEGASPSCCLFQLLKEAYVNTSTYSSLKLYLVCHSLCLQALRVNIASNFCSRIFLPVPVEDAVFKSIFRMICAQPAHEHRGMTVCGQRKPPSLRISKYFVV